jgi:hypothetical protein
MEQLKREKVQTTEIERIARDAGLTMEGSRAGDAGSAMEGSRVWGLGQGMQLRRWKEGKQGLKNRDSPGG